jgi:carbonic anhydrase
MLKNPTKHTEAPSNGANGSTEDLTIDLSSPRILLDDNAPGLITGKEALERLLEGNARFVRGATRHVHESANWRKMLANGQRPIATVLGCSDSRVPLELVFDQGFGDLFVVRVAGNAIARATMGSVEYALLQLKTPLVMVVGHEQCGAVTAALDRMHRNTLQSAGIEALLKLLHPGLKEIDPDMDRDRQIAAGVEANVRYSLRQLAEMPETARLLADGKVELVGAVYELESGTVRLLSDSVWA